MLLLFLCQNGRYQDIFFTQAQASASWYKHKHKACTRTNNQKYAAAVLMSEWKISRHSPKHRLVLVGMKHKHKACTRTNNQKYACCFDIRMEDIKTFPKHRLVLVGMKHKHKACTRTNNQKYACCFYVRMEDIKTFTQAQASASWYETQAQSMY